ncbi:hypothetical protein GCM10023156_26510 [Novipirellula rosea]|uniref:Secreted protein n=1 Tax=Novipirellula rosea TaxID=1031540 RepID=A0ABP8MQB7_9BACT
MHLFGKLVVHHFQTLTAEVSVRLERCVHCEGAFCWVHGTVASAKTVNGGEASRRDTRQKVSGGIRDVRTAARDKACVIIESRFHLFCGSR